MSGKIFVFLIFSKQDNADKRFDSNPLVGLTTQTQADKDELELPILNRVKKVTDSRKKRSHPYRSRTGRQSEYNPRFGYSPPANPNQQEVKLYECFNEVTLCVGLTSQSIYDHGVQRHILLYCKMHQYIFSSNKCYSIVTCK